MFVPNLMAYYRDTAWTRPRSSSTQVPRMFDSKVESGERAAVPTIV